ncbi:terminase family protein [Filomicrobium sp.]|uniref:DNA-packaging protein n=1 Tax=Filomicrobium sp. TaxID=2024831 RepID=UPI00258DC6FB|nr:terminase family protein [Filomicrobium sp.]
MERGTLERDLVLLSDDQVAVLHRDWQVWARDDQLPPVVGEDGVPWRVWLILGGRGAGKTRAGAEWVRAKALGLGPVGSKPAQRIALVGETIGEVRNVMVEGVSGILSVHGAGERPSFEMSKLQLTWSNGAVAQMFSAENPEGLRGPQFDAAWCDEIAKWRTADETWDMLQFGLRLGERPQVVATTTPRRVPILERLMEDESTVVSRSTTADNAGNLAPSFVAEMMRRYGGSVLGRQELFGEIIADDGGGLWRRDWIEEQRVASPPPLKRIVVAVDPPVTATVQSDACGIVVAGEGLDRRYYVLADRSIQGRAPAVWARAAIAAKKDFDADRVVAEVNQGGDLVASVLRHVDPQCPVRKVRATRGKWLRAEPVAALYAEGRVAHVGALTALEDEMCLFGTNAWGRGRSPDRLDALVWALSDLMEPETAGPAVRLL